MPSERAGRTKILRVVLWMTGALLAFSAMAVSIRELAGPLSIFEILVFRSASGVLVLGLLALMRRDIRTELTLRHLPLHGLRNVIHFGATYSWSLALTLLPMATVFALEFTAPAWVALLAVLLLGERLTVSRAGAVLLGFIGVLVILRPGYESFRPAAFLVLSAALGFAIVAIITKKLTQSQTTIAILFWMNLIQLPLTLAGSDPGFLARLTPDMTLPIIAIGIAGLASHFCLTNAFRSGDAMIVVPLDFLRIPLIALVGATVYAEPLDAFVFIGAGIIIAGILWNLHAEARKHVEPTDAA